MSSRISLPREFLRLIGCTLLLVTLAGCCCCVGGGNFAPAKTEHVVTVTDDNFYSVVLDSDKPVLVDFWAPWCGPCRMVDPAVVAVAADFEDRINTGRLNVDENQATAAEYQVWSIPTLALFHDGELVAQQVGVPGNGGDVEIALRNWVESQLSSLAADASIVPEDDAAEADSATESDVVEQAVDLPDVPQGQADDQEDNEGGN